MASPCNAEQRTTPFYPLAFQMRGGHTFEVDRPFRPTSRPRPPLGLERPPLHSLVLAAPNAYADPESVVRRDPSLTRQVIRGLHARWISFRGRTLFPRRGRRGGGSDRLPPARGPPPSARADCGRRGRRWRPPRGECWRRNRSCRHDRNAGPRPTQEGPAPRGSATGKWPIPTRNPSAQSVGGCSCDGLGSRPGERPRSSITQPRRRSSRTRLVAHGHSRGSTHNGASPCGRSASGRGRKRLGPEIGRASCRERVCQYV